MNETRIMLVLIVILLIFVITLSVQLCTLKTDINDLRKDTRDTILPYIDMVKNEIFAEMKAQFIVIEQDVTNVHEDIEIVNSNVQTTITDIEAIRDVINVKFQNLHERLDAMTINNGAEYARVKDVEERYHEDLIKWFAEINNKLIAVRDSVGANCEQIIKDINHINIEQCTDYDYIKKELGKISINGHNSKEFIKNIDAQLNNVAAVVSDYQSKLNQIKQELATIEVQHNDLYDSNIKAIEAHLTNFNKLYELYDKQTKTLDKTLSAYNVVVKEIIK